MKVCVIYHSKTGNTKKVAEAIANAADTTAVPVSEARQLLSEPVDLLFVGDGMYYGGMDKSMRAFIECLDASQIRAAAVFATSGGSWPMGPSGLRGQLKNRGIRVLDQSFKCHGGAFGIAFSSHPNEEDLKAARQFARGVISSIHL
ncbi:MAG: hypothetical protein LIO46_00640 [Clostridiales bacterium]|nr:hypothetical protein [Clostridiales bacterium]